jgi:hypothetical protein
MRQNDELISLCSLKMNPGTIEALAPAPATVSPQPAVGATPARPGSFPGNRRLQQDFAAEIEWQELFGAEILIHLDTVPAYYSDGRFTSTTMLRSPTSYVEPVTGSSAPASAISRGAG